MDRIDIQGPNGIAARLRARAAAPVARAEKATPTATESEQAGAASLAGIGHAGSDAPVDQTRVGKIREAIAQGRYLLDPAKTADAMIAAGFMLRNER